MKLLVFDQYEFEPADSEQTLVFACSHQKHCSDVDLFFQATCSFKEFFGERCSSLPSSTPLKSVTDRTNLSTLLLDFCNVTLTGEEQLYVVHGDWDLKDYVFKQENYYMRYRWSTSA